MEKDPAFYSKFSKMLEDVLAALYQKRMQAIEALEKIKDIATKVAIWLTTTTHRLSIAC